jgi:hypothetical protein
MIRHLKPNTLCMFHQRAKRHHSTATYCTFSPFAPSIHSSRMSTYPSRSNSPALGARLTSPEPSGPCVGIASSFPESYGPWVANVSSAFTSTAAWSPMSDPTLLSLSTSSRGRGEWVALSCERLSRGCIRWAYWERGDTFCFAFSPPLSIFG